MTQHGGDFGIAERQRERRHAVGLRSPRRSRAEAAMQHDLQAPLPVKKRLRRLIQRLLAGRQWPETGEDEFFRKAVRRHELFWVRPLGE